MNAAVSFSFDGLDPSRVRELGRRSCERALLARGVRPGHARAAARLLSRDAPIVEATPGLARAPAPMPVAPSSGVSVRPAVRRTRAACSCAHCLAAPSRHVQPDPDEVFEPRRPLGVGKDGVRSPGEPSRYLEIRALERLRAEGDDYLAIAPRMLGLNAPAQRQSRADYSPTKDPPRILRPLSEPDRRTALDLLQTWPMTRSVWALRDPDGGRLDWLAESWRELVEPPADVERVEDLATRVTRAIWRAEYRLRSLRNEIALPESFLDSEVSRHAD